MPFCPSSFDARSASFHQNILEVKGEPEHIHDESEIFACKIAYASAAFGHAAHAF